MLQLPHAPHHVWAVEGDAEPSSQFAERGGERADGPAERLQPVPSRPDAGLGGGKLTSWFKQPKPKLNADEERIAASVLWALRGDAGQRAITAWSFGWPEAHRASGNHWQAAFLGQLLDDPYDGVRFVAHKTLKRLPGFAEFPYDFVGPPTSRAAASQRARQMWESGAKRPFAAATLIDSNGRVMDLDFQRLLKLRDDRPVDISE